ncbi:MAG: prolyl oligopeptidase family serine peptidase, partial [Gillisia sp.]
MKSIKILLPLFFFIFAFQLLNAQTSSLTVEKIMRDPKWMGTFPSQIHWGAHSNNIYFNYNRDNDPADSLYKISINNPSKIEKVPFSEEKNMIPQRGDYNSDASKKVFVRDGILYLYTEEKNSTTQLLDLGNRISNPQFLADENKISFNADNNIFVYNLQNGHLRKLTNIHEGNKQMHEEQLSTRDQYLKDENLSLLGVVKEREDKKEASEQYREKTEGTPYAYYTGNSEIRNLQLSPDEKYVTFNLITNSDNKRTHVPNYVDASGYVTEIPGRTNVGDTPDVIEMAIYNLAKDTVYVVNTDKLPGITDLPDYTKDYPDKTWEKHTRAVAAWGPYFSDSGKKAVVNVRSQDNKDRWIALLDMETGQLKNLDRQRDEAWINGPGIGYGFGGETMGWLPDNEHIYYQSEATGYSHLYIQNVENGKKKQLTKGDFEVFDPFISKDKKHWFLTTSEVGPGERHFYKMPLMGGKMEKLTSMTGNNEVHLSPDEKHMAILYSFSNKPWELYLKETDADAEAKQLTFGQSDEFKGYNWRAPEIVHFKASDGVMVPARIYVPEASAKNGAAVIFVHGAGYLQNVHKWWSDYFREYMFNNMLTDLGYTVLDIDYRGSAGYGRDWRTAIYRHMGGKDLSDQVDGAHFLAKDYGIDADRIGIYGGSYGGFMTLMAMFTEPGVFKSGAALRSVTDWAHYNGPYTSNILNNPQDDPIAYKRSSPIYFADGLQGNLLIEHGMVDTNVHFQDVVRLTQKLIEL